MSYILLFTISMLAGLLVFQQTKPLKPIITILLSFSGSYLLSICFLHLLPELFEENGESLGMYLLIGFFLQLILDYFSGGIEHGHAHVNKKKIGKFPILIFLSLSVHAFLEAIPMHQIEENSSMYSYLLGLSIHKVPISFIFATLLMGYQLKKNIILVGILLFSIMGPLGVWVGSYFIFPELLTQKILAISVGIILHLSTTILLETNDQHKVQFNKLTPLFGGIGFALLTLLFH